MPESRLIREVRARQEAQAQDDLVDLVIEMFPDLLMAALEQPEVCAVIRDIATVARSGPSTTPSPAARRSAARGGRRV